MMPESILRAACVQEALTWIGTPYHHAASIKGVGVDCVYLALAVYDVAHIKKPIIPSPYIPNWFLHHCDEIVLTGMVDYGMTEVSTPKVGDLAAVQFGRAYSHILIMLDEVQCVHACDIHKQVMLGKITEHPLANRPIKYFSAWAN